MGLSDRDVEAAIRQRVDLIKTRVHRYERIRKFALISNDFPEELRSITTLRKIKIDCQAIEDGYRAKIEAIYSSGQCV
jgi:long-subunit acyl-CoA synthetase (AMP-forming)